MRNLIFSLIIFIFHGFTPTSGQINPYLTLSDSSITYIYNVNGDSVPYIKTLCSSKWDTTSITTMKFKNSQWVYDSKVKYTSNLTSSHEYNYTWSGARWLPEVLTIKEFEGKNVSKESHYLYSADSMSWICDLEIEYFRDVCFAVDSIYSYQLNNDSTGLDLVEKEFRTNSYDKPIQALHYNYSNEKGWELTGKTEYMYDEENHDVTTVYYTYKKDFEPEKRTCIDYDTDGNMVHLEKYRWQNKYKNWLGVNLYVKNILDKNDHEEITYAFDGQNLSAKTKIHTHTNDTLNLTVIETLSWIDSLTKWNMSTKTTNKNLTIGTITQKNTVMDEVVYLSERNIVVQNDKYSQSNYSLYSLNGSLLQKGTLAQNQINIDPEIHEKTLVLILSTHSAIFSKKLQFMQ
jgi:hypothetical protein